MAEYENLSLGVESSNLSSPANNYLVGTSYNGSTVASEAIYRDSNSCVPANLKSSSVMRGKR